MKNKKYIQLCIKSLNEEITPAEKVQLDKWLELSDENKSRYENIKQLWNSAIPEEPSKIPDKYEELNKLQNSIDYSEEKVKNLSVSIPKLTSQKFGFMKPKYRFSFALALVLLLSISTWYLIFERNSSQQLTEIVTQNKQITQLQLPDSSNVKINSGSILRYPSEFLAPDRKIYLEGEAYFEVEKDHNNFQVETQNARIIVVGTKFNVSSRSGVTKVIVKEGIVHLDSKKNEKNSVQLTKGYMSSIEKYNLPLQPKEVNTEYMLGWLKGVLVFEKISLVEIIGELERYYDTKIEITSKELAKKTLTASYDNAKIDDVLSSICLALNVQFKYESGGYKIY